MSTLVIKQAKGANKEEAAKNAGFNFDIKFDATQAHGKARKEVDFDVRDFATEYITRKVKGASNIGFCVTLEAAVEDSRTRPYKEEVIATDGKRKFKTFYEVISADGRILGKAERKDEASKLAKQLISYEKQDNYTRLVKLPVEGQPLAAKLTYTPSAGTKEGNYIFFAFEG